MSNTQASSVSLGSYQHYKGQRYEVIGLALHTETEERLVVYRALYETPELEHEFGMRPLFVRPVSMFQGTVDFHGQPVPRFRLLSDHQ